MARVIPGVALVGATPTPPVRVRVLRGHYSGGVLRHPDQVLEIAAAEYGELLSYGLVERVIDAPQPATPRLLPDAAPGDSAPAKGKRK